MKKYLMMIKKDTEDLENFTKYQVSDYAYVDGDIKVRGSCHITGKYRDCIINDITWKL